MRNQLEKLLLRVEEYLGRAENLQDNENDKIALRYEVVAECLETAKIAIEEAISQFDE